MVVLSFQILILCYKHKKIMWIKRLIEETPKQWKLIPSMYLSIIGGTTCVNINFNYNFQPKHIAPFYMYCFEAWSNLTYYEPQTARDFLVQPLWNNRNLPLKLPESFISLMIHHNIKFVKDLFKVTGVMKNLSDIISLDTKEYSKYIMMWFSLTQNHGNKV